MAFIKTRLRVLRAEREWSQARLGVLFLNAIHTDSGK